MRKESFWALLGDAEREAITAVARSRVFRGGVTLCIQGEPSTHVFILVSGWVKAITATDDGREILEALRGEGDVIGEIAGQVTGYRTATVQAIGPVRTLIVGAEQFGEFLDARPVAARAHRRATAEHQRQAQESHRNHVQSSGPRRLACLLLDLAEHDDDSSGQVLATALPLSQEELASLIGVSRSTVTRALHDWRSRRIIQTNQRQIAILDQARLLGIAGRSPRTLKRPRQAGAIPC